MDTRHKYLNGDVDFLGNVDKIIPRKMELPLLMQTKIQIRKNMFGIRSRLFRHVKSYNYKFRSLATEPKQVIRALRPHVTIKLIAKRPQKIPKNDRCLAEKSSEWKLPPNVYNLDDFTKSLKKMGKRGPYQCFTVERDDKTVKNHHAPKPEDERCETDFYDLPSQLDDGMKPSNFYKNKFLKAPRFATVKNDGVPPPTKYFPQNFAITLSASDKKKRAAEINPIFYYPQTSVPVREMAFNKAKNTPEPGRYNLHNLSCQCHFAEMKERMPPKFLEKHRFVPTRAKGDKKQSVDDISLLRKSFSDFREPISFRLRSSISFDDLFSSSAEREICYNTMIKRKNVFSTKSGRPVAFLTAAPRFKESSEKPIKLYKQKKTKKIKDEAAPEEETTAVEKATTADEEAAAPADEGENVEDEKTSTDTTVTKTDKPKPKLKAMTKKRILELATPKALAFLRMKNASDKVKVFSKPASTFKTLASSAKSLRKVKGMADIDIKRLRDAIKKEQEEVVEIQEQHIFVYKGKK